MNELRFLAIQPRFLVGVCFEMDFSGAPGGILDALAVFIMGIQGIGPTFLHPGVSSNRGGFNYFNWSSKTYRDALGKVTLGGFLARQAPRPR